LRLTPQKLGRIRILLSAILIATTLIFVSLSLMSASNYTEIAYAKLSARANADVHMTAANLEPSGEVTDNTIFWFNVTVNITNPGSRTIRLQFITYQGALKDYITEDLFGGGNQRIFYSSLVRMFSYQSNKGFIAPGSTSSLDISWNLNKTDSVAFQGTKRILNYALTNASHLLRWDQVEWNHFFVFQLIVTGVPIDYGGPSSGYLIELPVIRLYQGNNVGVR